MWYLSPGFELQYGANPENSLSLGYFHDFILYTENGDFNGNQDRVQFDARMELGRFTVVGYNSVAWLDTILGGSTAVVRREPIRRQVWTDNYQITYDSSVKTDVYVIFNHSAVNYLEVVNLYNQATLRGTVGATYKPTERIGLFSEISGGIPMSRRRLHCSLPVRIHGSTADSSAFGAPSRRASPERSRWATRPGISRGPIRRVMAAARRLGSV